MALEGADIAALKKRVPPQFKPDELNDGIGPAFDEKAADTGTADPVADAELKIDSEADNTPDSTDTDHAIAEHGDQKPEAWEQETVQPVLAPDVPDADETEGDPVKAVHEREKEQIQRDLDIVRKDNTDGNDDKTLNTGRQNPVVSGGSENPNARRNRKKQRDEVSRQLLLLQQQLDPLYADIAKIDAKLADNNEALDTINDIRALEASGEFDPENNPEHAAMLEKAGITLEDYKRDAQAALDERTRQLNEDNRRLQQDRQDRVEKIREIEKTSDPDDVEAYYETNQHLASNILDRAENRAIQGNNDGIEDTSDLEQFKERVVDKFASFDSTEDEVAAFMQDFARTKQIDDPMERLAREKELVDGLSDEAAEIVSFEEETEKLFEPDYFKPLETQSPTETGQAPPPDANPSL